MKILYILFLNIFAFTNASYSGDIASIKHDPPIPYTGSSSWGTDYLVSNSEPLGLPSGSYRQSNSTIYVAIPDTNIVSGSSIVVLTSSDNGVTWSVLTSVTPANVVTKTKMLKTTNDEVYCFFLLETTVYCWNVLTGTINIYGAYTNVRDFDAATSSSGALYLIIDLNTNNDVRFVGTTTGGATWVGAVYLSSAAARPRIYMSPGDTLLINYYGPIAGLSDTTTAAIRNVRYRETSPGSLLISGTVPTFTTIVPAGNSKPEFQGVLNGGNSWVFYTQVNGGNTDINCMVGSDNGTTYGAPFTIGAMPGRDEFWFDAKHYTFNGGGVDLIYFSDSTGSGNISDKMYHTNATVSMPSTFNTPESFSEHPPVWSARGYTPSLIEYYDGIGDVGAIWVGLDGSDRNLYFDRLQKLVGITNQNEIPEGFYLKQNYPNPFNPVTKIEFDIPLNEFVTLKVFDILGKEVTTLISQKMSPGSYSIDFNAANISSGVYFYKISVGTFTDTKSMIILK